MNKKNRKLANEIRDKKIERFNQQAKPIVDAFSTIIKNQRELDKKISDMFEG